MNEKKAIFMNTASQSAARIAGLFFTLISTKLITNYFGRDGTGEFNTINTYINFLIVAADLGLFTVTVREIVKNPDKEKSIISNVFIIRFITALAAAAIASAAIFFTDYNDNVKFGTLIASGYILMNLLSSVYDVILQSRLKMQYSALAELISKVVTVLALALVVRFHGSFLHAVSTITLAGLIVFIIKWHFAKRFLRFSPSYDSKVSSWIMALAWPMGIVFIINNLYFKIDTLLLFHFKGAGDTGIYTTAYKVLEVAIFAGSYYASSLKPIISRDIDNNKQRVANIISKSIVVMLLLSIPITIVSAIFAKEIILFLSNADFLAGDSALVVLSLALPLIYLDILLGEILVANDQRRLLLRIAAFILSFNLILNLLLIPRFSFMGAAITTVLSEFVLLVVNLYYTRHIIPYRLNYKRFAQIAVVAMLTLLAGYLLCKTGAYFLILIAAIFAVYASLAYAFGLFNLKLVREVVQE